MIVNTIDQCLFRQTFHNYGRGDQFSYEGLNALFDYLEELSEDTGANIELYAASLQSMKTLKRLKAFTLTQRLIPWTTCTTTRKLSNLKPA
jgi:hypothetical protein